MFYILKRKKIVRRLAGHLINFYKISECFNSFAYLKRVLNLFEIQILKTFFKLANELKHLFRLEIL